MLLMESRVGGAQRRVGSGSRLLVVCVLLGSFACAPKQRVPLDISPSGTSIFLNGEELEEMPPELKLRSDRDHMLFFKSEGHRSELVVLRSKERDGEPHLEPSGVRLRLAPLDPTRRDLVIEAGPEPEAPPGKAGQVEPDVSR
jgi:hypothetical protein